MKLSDSSNGDFKIEEAGKGSNALAKVSGTFFAVDGPSQNGRFYTKGLWEKALKKTKDVIENKQMLGFLGHATSDADENLENASHIVTDLHIDEKGRGVGTYEVLDTVPGRALNSLLRAGVKLGVSSRANGSMSNERRNGIPVVNEDTFRLSHFDIVRRPGIKDAMPNLMESLNEGLGEEEKEALQAFLESKEDVIQETEQLDDAVIYTKGENEMSGSNTGNTDLLEKAYKEKGEVQEQLDAALEANDTLKGEKAVLESKVESEVSASTKLQEELDAAKASLAEATTKLEAKDQNKSEAETMLEGFQALGTVEEIEGVMDLAEDYVDLGTNEELTKVMDLAEEYITLGTVEEIKGIMDKMEEMLDEAKEAEHIATVKKLAEETGVSEERAESLLEKMEYDDAVALVSDVSESINIAPQAGNKNKLNENKGGKEEHKSVLNESRGTRLYKHCS